MYSLFDPWLKGAFQVGGRMVRKSPLTLPPPLMRPPPFPGSSPCAFAVPRRVERTDAEVDEALESLGAMRVGGTYWGRRPLLTDGPYALICVRNGESCDRVLDQIDANRRVVCWSEGQPAVQRPGERPIKWVAGCCDPWHMVEHASEVFAHAESEIILIAALAGKRTRLFGKHVLGNEHHDVRDLLRRHPAMDFTYQCPFTGDPVSFLHAVEHCDFWRKLVDSNRPLVAAVGFAAWKRPTIAPLLWGGATDVKFVSTAANLNAGDEVGIWMSRASAPIVADLKRRKAHLVEVEDGFIRSVGLGAECVPPLSIVVDRLGAYFDPSGPSELEMLIEEREISSTLLKRARNLREMIVKYGVSKYGTGTGAIAPRPPDQRHLLVVGQVEDDRSVVSGGGEVATNLNLLQRVRSLAPDAFITYKPHPDVEAGHRLGGIPRRVALAFADAIAPDEPIGALIAIVDEVHVNTSLAGFEALLRGRPVVTHGVPFYAGWGLTQDLGAVPKRRMAKRTLDELVAAVLLLYPRYLDPVTGLPCPPEILIKRLTVAAGPGSDGMLVAMRRLQGRFRRKFWSIRERWWA